MGISPGRRNGKAASIRSILMPDPIVCVEHAILKGRIEKKLLEDLRGTRYRIEGPAKDGRLVHVICKLREDASLVIITVYALKEEP